jgi:hypothetical protein
MELEKGLIRYVQVAVPDLRVVSFSIYGFDDCLEIKFFQYCERCSLGLTYETHLAFPH